MKTLSTVRVTTLVDKGVVGSGVDSVSVFLEVPRYLRSGPWSVPVSMCTGGWE